MIDLVSLEHVRNHIKARKETLNKFCSNEIKIFLNSLTSDQLFLIPFCLIRSPNSIVLKENYYSNSVIWIKSDQIVTQIPKEIRTWELNEREAFETWYKENWYD